MMLSAEEIELRYHQRVKEQAYEQERKRFANPDRDAQLEHVWVAYVWTPTQKSDVSVGEWLLAGFRRKRNLRKQQTMGRFFSKIRRKLGVDKKSPVLLLDLSEASRRIRSADQVWRTRPPQFQVRKTKPIPRAPSVLSVRPRGKGPRIKQRALLFNKKTTQFIALGRSSWAARGTDYLFLGPLQSTQKRLAQFEAKRLFGGLYDDLLAIAVTELSKPLRAAMARSRSVRAGVTRIVWPEIPPTFVDVWQKFAHRMLVVDLHGFIQTDDPRLGELCSTLHSMWQKQGRPWLTLAWFHKQIKPWRLQCAAVKARRAKRKATRRMRSGRKQNVKRVTIKKRYKRIVRRKPNVMHVTATLLGRLRIVAVLNRS